VRLQSLMKKGGKILSKQGQHKCTHHPRLRLLGWNPLT